MATPLHEADGQVYVALSQLMALEFQARSLSFVARQPQASILAGNHASRLRGRGLNFDELRRYQPGDDLRHLDWRATRISAGRSRSSVKVRTTALPVRKVARQSRSVSYTHLTLPTKA